MITLHQCVINNLVLPCHGAGNQNWPERSLQLNNYTRNMSVNFLRLAHDNINLKHEEMYENASIVLRVQEGVLKNYEDNSSTVKNMLKCAYEVKNMIDFKLNIY